MASNQNQNDKVLARAKRVRDRRLARTTALFAACNCEWPIRNLRNGSGHSSQCPAHALHQQFAEEDEDARAELEG